jgi:hypothetical protein
MAFYISNCMGPTMTDTLLFFMCHRKLLTVFLLLGCLPTIVGIMTPPSTCGGGSSSHLQGVSPPHGRTGLVECVKGKRENGKQRTHLNRKTDKTVYQRRTNFDVTSFQH